MDSELLLAWVFLPAWLGRLAFVVTPAVTLALVLLLPLRMLSVNERHIARLVFTGYYFGVALVPSSLGVPLLDGALVAIALVAAVVICPGANVASMRRQRPSPA